MYKKYITCLFAIGFAGIISAQNINQAKQLFLNGEYSKAEPMFQSFLKKSPSNANYNYWYGTCLYKNGEIHKSLPYLKKGAAGKITNAYKILGEAFYDIYHFEEAEDNYSKYIQVLEKEKKSTSEAEVKLNEMTRASRMIKGVENITVVDSFVVDKKDFLKAYKISKDCGNVSQNSDNSGTTYTTENGNNRITSMPDLKGKLQLFSSIKMINGWSDLSPITSLNGDFDINYPFLMSDGITLYYASNNDNSLGGYDIFVTRYDSDDSKYLRPDNLGMPFNSPYNDYMLVIDESNNLGWFASDRFQPEDKVCIYLFVPNSSKIVYDYESMTAAETAEVATLRPIKVSQKDKAKVAAAKKRLESEINNSDNNDEESQKDFTFVVDDTATYHSLNDFKSTKAKNLFSLLQQNQADYDSLMKQLDEKREQYSLSDNKKKESLAPSILDLEKRTETMKDELEALTIKVRNEEISKIKR